jgi:hypothetical protein
MEITMTQINTISGIATLSGPAALKIVPGPGESIPDWHLGFHNYNHFALDEYHSNSPLTNWRAGDTFVLTPTGLNVPGDFTCTVTSVNMSTKEVYYTTAETGFNWSQFLNSNIWSHYLFSYNVTWLSH